MTGPIDLAQTTPPTTIKFLCSYGGKIVPRHPDGKLRYNGGHTRVLAVDCSISFSELLVKLVEMSGTSISLRCQLPNEDMDALVSITSDEDLANLIEEYDHHLHQDASSNSSLKIRVFLYPPKSIKRVSPTPSIAASSINDALKFPPKSAIRPCLHHVVSPLGSRLCYEKGVGKLSRYGPRNAGHVYLIHHGNHWQ